MYREVLRFWFEETPPQRWWAADPAFDDVIRQRFLSLLEQAARCELFPWRHEPAGRLAEIIVLDQFSRQVFRDTPRAFAQDPLALGLSQEAVRQGVHALLNPVERTFLLMPYMHSESAAIHAVAEPLFREFTPSDNHDYERRHKAIIDRFGRYPHRNTVLGRPSTPQEEAFLLQPGSRF